MTVNDLIKVLQTLPPDLTVVNEGYETGFEPIKSVTIIEVDENKSHEWWDGKFEKSNKTGKMQVVFLNADTRNSNQSGY
jgi:hypothetical protein